MLIVRVYLKLSFFKNTSALEQIGPRVSKVRSTKMYVLAITTYFSSLREAASLAAALPAIREVDVKKEFAMASITVTFHTKFLPTCKGTKVKPPGRFPSVRERLIIIVVVVVVIVVAIIVVIVVVAVIIIIIIIIVVVVVVAAVVVIIIIIIIIIIFFKNFIRHIKHKKNNLL